MKISNMFIFAMGAMFGSTITWYFLKKKYKQMAQEEIDSVKESYRERDDTKTVESQKKEIKDYLNRIYGTNGYAAEDSEEKGEQSMNGPYIISPNEFGTIDEYEIVSLTYYSDQILVDDNGDIIDDIDELIGEDSLTHFGEYEDDSIFVRNDERKCDYEILYDNRSYYDTIGNREE